MSAQERASIAIETTATRAVRWAMSVDGARHVAVVGPPGAGKTFAAQLADGHGVLRFELPSAGAAIAGETVRGIVAALREGRRLLLTAGPDDLSTWAARDDLDGALATILREAREAAGARDDWPPQTNRSIEVLDLSSAVTARAEVVDELLRRAASLALGAPRDAARAAASAALRDRGVRAWARACALDAERRLGPLTISDLWRFVAALACGERPPRDAGRFDLADSVVARLLRHEFTSEATRAFARRQGALREEVLAIRVGFDGAVDDVYCSDPQALAGQSAVFLVEPPPPEAPQDDYRALVTRLTASGRMSVRSALSPALAAALTTIASAGAGLPPPGKISAEREGAPREPSVDVSAAVPNPFTRQALDDAWVAALLARIGDQSFVIGARAFDAIRDLAGRPGPHAVTPSSSVSPRRRAAPGTAEEGRAIHARGASTAPTDVQFAGRPLGLLFALSERGSLDDAVLEGGAFRVASPADLGAMTSALSSHPEHVERWRAGDIIALGAPLREFIDARAGIVEVLAGMWSPSSDSRALDASLSLGSMFATNAPSSTAIERYVSAYSAMMDAAVAAGGEALDRALMLDIAYCPADTERRARLMPMHPLMVSRLMLGHGGGSEALPPVIAVRHQRTLALYAEGEPGFYHGEPERWPTIAEQRGAVGDATRAWLLRAGQAERLDVDLVDARFAALLIEEIASCAALHAHARGATPAVVRARSLASSLPRAASFAAITLDDAEGSRVVCDPSVRSSSEARTDAFVFAVIPAPHGGRRSGVASDHLPGVVASYARALAEVRIDPRPHRLEPSPEPSAPFAAFISWKASPLAGGSDVGQWQLSLRDDVAPAPPPMSASSQIVSTLSAPEVPRAVEVLAMTAAASVEVSPVSEDRRRPDHAEDCDGDVLGGDEAVASMQPRRWTRMDLREQVTRTLGRAAYMSDEALVADLIRDAVSARRAPLRHVVVRDVAECVGPLLERGEPQEVVARTVEVLVDLGDLVARRSSDRERAPYLLELASAAFVELQGSRRAILLGRAEVALSDNVRASVATEGILRTIDLAKAPEARDELRFRGAAEIAWRDWARAPPFGTPDEALGAQGDMTPFKGTLKDFDAFDPTTPPRYYRGRFRHGELERLLTRDRWAVAARDAGFDAREYRLFRRTDGVVTSTVVNHAHFVQLAAACAARAAGGRRFIATDGDDAVRLYFPPTRWLARLLAAGHAVDAGDALVAWRLPDELRGDIRSAIQRGLWCEIVSN